MNDQEQVKLLCNIFGIGTLDFAYFVDRIGESGVDREELADWINDRVMDYAQNRTDFNIDLNFMLYDFVLDKICDLCNSDDNDQSSMDVLSSVLRDTITVFGNYLDTWYVSHEDELYKNYCENFLSSHPQYIEYVDKESLLRSSYIATIGRFMCMCEESERFNKLVEFVGIKESLSNEIA